MSVQRAIQYIKKLIVLTRHIAMPPVYEYV